MMEIKDTLKILIEAAKFLKAKPRRRIYVLLPVILNIVIWSAVLPVAFLFARWVTSAFLPETIWGTAITIIAGFVAVLAVLMLGVFLFVALTAILGAPFYSVLAEEVWVEAGRKVPGIWWPKEIWQSFTYTGRLIVFFLIAQLFLLLFNLLPVIGTAIHAIGVFSTSLLFVAMEFYGEAFARDQLSFRQRLVYLARYHLDVIAFVVPIFFLLLIPVVNLFIPALAVVAATKQYVTSKER